MKTKKDILQSIARTNKEIADAMDNLATETDLINTGTEPEFPEKLVSVGGLYSVYDQPNGIPTLNGSGLINSDQLPSYVDDAIEGYYYNGAFYSDSSHQYEIVPESGKIYIDITDPDHAQSYRWTGSTYSIIADPREALFDVTFTEPVPGNLNSDKTLAEIEEAVSDGKVVRGFFGNITYYLTSIQHDTNVKFNAAIKNINYNIEGKYLNSAWNWTYNSWDLSNIKPDWNATAGADNEILNKPDLPTNTSFDDIFYINILSDNSIITIQNSRNDDVTLMYSLDKTTWTTITIVSNASNQYLFNKGKVYFKSDLGYLGIDDGTTTKYVGFSVDKDFEIGGKLVYLISSNGIEPTTIPSKCFLSTFSSSHLISAKNLILLSVAPARCYYTTFQSTSLVETPNLIAEYPESGAYYGMFAHTENTLRRVISSAKIWTSQDMYIGNSWYSGGEFINLGMAPSVIRTRAGAPTDWTIKTPAFINDFKNIPTPTQADSGKLLSVDASGNYELITIVNSENIAY